MIMNAVARAITITILFLLARPVTAAAPPPPHHAWLPYAARQDPCAATDRSRLNQSYSYGATADLDAGYFG